MMNCEYLVYATDGLKLSYEELSSAFEILTTIPYPYNTNPYNAAALSNLTQSQRNLLDSNETAVVLELLQQINPRINIVPFPKSMVQYYLFAGVTEIRISEQHELFIQELKEIEQKILYTYEKNFRDNWIKLYGEMTPKDEKVFREVRMAHIIPWRLLPQVGSNILEDCIKANSDPRTKQIWMTLNNALLRELFNDEQYPFNHIFLLKKINIWTAEYFKEYPKDNPIELDHHGVPYYDFREHIENIDILRKFLTFEVNSIFNPRINHLYIIYRASMGPYADINVIKDWPDHTLSLNNGICEGTANDVGANAWYYSSVDDNDKYNYRRTSYAFIFDPVLDKDTLMIPPSNIVSRTLGYGEDFHVRTKIHKNERNKALLLTNAFIIIDRLTNDEKAYETLLKRQTGTLTAYLNSKIDNSICSPWPEYLPAPVSEDKTNTITTALIGTLPYACLTLFCIYLSKKALRKCANSVTDKGTDKEHRPLLQFRKKMDIV